MSEILKVPVLIVGGGPVGLALATDLGWRGVSCLLAERRDGSVRHPKMNMVSARTMEFCRRWGIADEVRKLSIPEDFPRNILFVTSANGYELARFSYPSRADAPQPHSPVYLQRCSQLRFDPLLQRTAGSFKSVSLHFETELQSLEQDADGVTASLRHTKSGAEITVRADYVVGCDGAESTVRESSGVSLSGQRSMSEETNVFYVSDDIKAMCPHGKAIMQWLLGPAGYWGVIVSVDGIREWRLGVKHSERDGALTQDQAAAAIGRAVGRDFVFEIKSMLPWTRRSLMAQSYRVGRVFLAGDAAHQLSPTGGFGMNTGIGDAIDLSWKLAATVQGWGGPSLLDSYQIERIPAGMVAINEGGRNFNAIDGIPAGPEIDEDSDRGNALRSRISSFILSNGYDREYDTDGITFGTRYDGSTIIVPDGTPASPQEITSYHPTARPGHRAPHAWIDGNRSTLDLFGRGFTLLAFDGGRSDASGFGEAVAARKLPLKIEAIDDAAVHRLYERRFVLVRPDGHVAWRADECPANPGALLDRVRGCA